MFEIAILSFAVHSIAHTIATQVVFKPLRDRLVPVLGEYWSHLIKCPYCMGYHITWMLLLAEYLITGALIKVITGNLLLDAFILWMAIAACANIITWILCDKIKAPKKDS
jgi:hypothetical protein